MPTGARAVRREHVQSYFAERRETVKPTRLSVEFRALQQFWKWALDEHATGKAGHRRSVRFGARTAVAIDRYLRLRCVHAHADSPAPCIGQARRDDVRRLVTRSKR